MTNDILELARHPSEKKFAKICIRKNYKITHSTEDQDMHEHWDWKTTNPSTNKVSLIDVKGARKRCRKDENVDFSITWLEIKNVNGEKGSLLGLADYIAFEQVGHFLIVRRENLRGWLKKKIINKKIVNNPEDALYRYYKRSDRKDIITLVNIEDIVKDLKTWKFF